MQTLPTQRARACRATRRCGGEGLPSDGSRRGDADPRGAGRSLGDEPLSLPPGLQSHDRRYAESLCGSSSCAACRDELGRTGTVTEAIYGAGFNSNGHFYATASDLLGMTPTSFRAGGSGASIRFAVGECSLGSILIAATEKGVCAILLGDDPGALVRDLQDRFPKAQLIGGDRGFEQTVARVVGFVEAPALGLDLPLDVRGTAFQQRVWQALREIPAGSTASYTQIAARVGSPTAVRAVARACASNPIAVAIPCHRVVRNDGALSGYRWGVQRKRTLLEREAAS